MEMLNSTMKKIPGLKSNLKELRKEYEKELIKDPWLL